MITRRSMFTGGATYSAPATYKSLFRPTVSAPVTYKSLFRPRVSAPMVSTPMTMMPAPMKLSPSPRVGILPPGTSPPPTKGIGGQIIDYITTGKPITPPIAPVQTEVRIPTETKTFTRNTLLTLAGITLGGIILWKMLK